MCRIFQFLAIIGLFWCLLADYEPMEEENLDTNDESSTDLVTIKIGG